MLCKICNKTKLDGRKGETICQTCLDEMKAKDKIKQEKEKIKCDEIFDLLGKLLTPETIKSATARMRGNPLHQMVTKLIAYELISSHTVVFDDKGGVVADLIDVFVKASELDGIGSGTSYVTFAMESLVQKIKDITEMELKEKGVKHPDELGFLLGT